MEKTFEYLKVQTAMDSYSAADIGNTIIQAVNDDGLEWYLYISTSTGYTTTKEFGPLLNDSPDVPKNNFAYMCGRQEYNEKTICKTINNFLNNPRRAITQVMDIDEEELNRKLEIVRNIL